MKMRIEDDAPAYSRQRRVLKYGDQAILNRIITSPNWKVLFSKKFVTGMAVLTGSVLLLLVSGMASVPGVLLRFKHGNQTLGLIQMALTLNLLLLINTMVVQDWIKPLIFWAAPVALFLQDWECIWNAIVVDVHSKGLVILTSIYALMTMVHLVLIYLGRAMEKTQVREATLGFIIWCSGILERLVNTLFKAI